jgi:hypothetical protein
VEEAGAAPRKEILAAAEALAAWPKARDLAGMPIAALETHVGDALALCEELDALRDERVDSSGMADVTTPANYKRTTKRQYLKRSANRQDSTAQM